MANENNLTPFEDLTNDELLVLTEKDIEFYRTRTALELGVVLAPEIPPEPTKPVVEDMIPFHKLIGWELQERYSRPVLFRTQEAALRVVALLNQLMSEDAIVGLDYDYPHPGSDYPYPRPTDSKELGVATTMLVSAQAYPLVKERLKQYSQARSEWKKLKEARETYERELDGATERITERLSEAREFWYARYTLSEAWKQYRSVTTSVEEAKKFFELAYSAKLSDAGLSVDEIIVYVEAQESAKAADESDD